MVGGIGDTLPGEAVACNEAVDEIIAVVDGEVERYHAVAPGGVGERMGGMDIIVVVEHAEPDGGIADLLDFGRRGAVVDGQMESVHARPIGFGVGMVEEVGAGLGVAGSVPHKAVACRDGLGIVTMDNSEEQGDDTVAVVDIV